VIRETNAVLLSNSYEVKEHVLVLEPNNFEERVNRHKHNLSTEFRFEVPESTDKFLEKPVPAKSN
jgi:hypothetical protein